MRLHHDVDWLTDRVAGSQRICDLALLNGLARGARTRFRDHCRGWCLRLGRFRAGLTAARQRSCMLPLSEVGPEQRIVTIEGLSPDGSHPVQKAWLELDVPQCGYCQTGMIMAAAALLDQNASPTDADIDSEITNICRCGTYGRVRSAIKLAAGTSDAVRQG